MKRIVNIRLTDWRWNMKEYELIWEIFNKCPRNQMRDVFVEELELEEMCIRDSSYPGPFMENILL